MKKLSIIMHRIRLMPHLLTPEGGIIRPGQIMNRCDMPPIQSK